LAGGCYRLLPLRRQNEPLKVHPHGQEWGSGGSDPTFNSRRKQIVLQAMRHGLPAAYASREYAVIE